MVVVEITVAMVQLKQFRTEQRELYDADTHVTYSKHTYKTINSKEREKTKQSSIFAVFSIEFFVLNNRFSNNWKKNRDSKIEKFSAFFFFFKVFLFDFIFTY